MLTEKYGDPTESVEKFDSPIEGSDGKRKLLELAMDGCKYYTIYETEKGSIKLTLKNYGIMSGYVALSYFDKINSEKIRQKALDDL